MFTSSCIQRGEAASRSRRQAVGGSIVFVVGGRALATEWRHLDASFGSEFLELGPVRVGARVVRVSPRTTRPRARVPSKSNGAGAVPRRDLERRVGLGGLQPSSQWAGDFVRTTLVGTMCGMMRLHLYWQILFDRDETAQLTQCRPRQACLAGPWESCCAKSGPTCTCCLGLTFFIIISFSHFNALLFFMIQICTPHCQQCMHQLR